MKTITLSSAFLMLFGCAIAPSVEVLQEFKPESKNIVLLNSTIFDKDLRTSLTKLGFKVKKYVSIDYVKQKSEKEDVSFNKAEAKYGIELRWEYLDRCIFNSSKKINAFIELVDLSKNEVILYLERGGWTGNCFPGGKLFDEIAMELNKYWN